MDSTIIGALIGVIGALVGTLIGGRLSKHATIIGVESSNQNAHRIMQRQEFNKAETSFRLGFLELLLLLKEDIKPKDFTNLHSYLASMYPKHATAIIKLRPYLDKSRIERVDKAWFNYKFPNDIANGEENKESFPLGDYAHMTEGQATKIALENIEKLLSVCDHIF